MTTETVGIIGLGLIGGSIAKGLSDDYEILGFDSDKNNLQNIRSPELEIEENPIDLVRNSSILFLCTPIDAIREILQKIEKMNLNDEQLPLITDVGSTKSCIMDEVGDGSLSKHFIGGHPMAGSEKSGWNAAEKLMFDQSFWILTPSGKPLFEPKRLFLLHDLLSNLKAYPIIIDDEFHDRLIAIISHLPHLISFSYANFINSHDHSGLLKTLGAGSFRDLTRISEASEDIWTNIFESNEKNLETISEEYLDSLREGLEFLNRGEKKLGSWISESSVTSNSIEISDEVKKISLSKINQNFEKAYEMGKDSWIFFDYQLESNELIFKKLRQ